VGLWLIQLLKKLRQNFIIHQLPIKALPQHLHPSEILLSKRKLDPALNWNFSGISLDKH
jgi:hypothetical protein